MADGGASSSSQQESIPKPWELPVQRYMEFRHSDNEAAYITKLTSELRSNSLNQQLEACCCIRTMLVLGPFPPFSEFIKNDVVPLLVQFLNAKDAHLQAEAVYILGLFAQSNAQEVVDCLVKADAVPEILKLVQAGNGLIPIMAIDTLGYIAQKSPSEIRDHVWEPLLAFIRMEDDSSGLIIAARTLEKFVSCTPPLTPPLTPEKASEVLPELLKFLRSKNEIVVAIGCCVLFYLLQHKIGHVEPEILSRVSAKLVDMLHHSSSVVIRYAVITIARISGDDFIDQNANVRDEVIHNVIKPMTLRCLASLLSGKYDNKIKRGACLTVRNITNKECNHIKEVVNNGNNGIIRALAGLYDTCEDDIKMEVICAILNVTNFGNPEDVRKTTGALIEPLCGMLNCPHDLDLALACLRGLYRIIIVWQIEVLNRGASREFDSYKEKIVQCGGRQNILDLQNRLESTRSHVWAADIAWSIMQTQWPRNHIESGGGQQQSAIESGGGQSAKRKRKWGGFTRE